MGWSSWALLLSFLIHSQSLHSSSLSAFPSPFPPPLCHPSEGFALLRFRNSFSVRNGSTTVSWQNGTNCCDWDGVSCDSKLGHVIGLDLSSSFLQGPLHSNSSLFSLVHLEFLYIEDVDFCGSPIPPEIGGFANMTDLLFFNTNLTGQVPVELSHLSKLVGLTLSSINTIDLKLIELKLEQYVFKRMLQNLTNLRELSLFGLNMVYVDPVASLMNISSSLEVLYIEMCQLQGKFPKNIFRLPNLRELHLDYIFDLVVSLPTNNWTSLLTYLSLSNTKISIDLPYLIKSGNSLQSLILSDNNFVGQLPEIDVTKSSQIHVPLNLKCLDLSGNFLTGSIPSWIFSLPSLVFLSLYNNHFTDCLQEFKSQSLVGLLLTDNKLDGRIPNSVFQQQMLSYLDLSSNNLSGVLEFKMFSKWKNLESLMLSFNKFSFSSDMNGNRSSFQLRSLGLASCNICAFPHFLSSFERLDFLDLSNNQLQGRVPRWIGNEGASSLTYLNLSHNFLTHIEEVPWKSLEYLDLRSNMLQGHLPILPSTLVGFFISNNQLIGEIYLLCFAI